MVAASPGAPTAEPCLQTLLETHLVLLAHTFSTCFQPHLQRQLPLPGSQGHGAGPGSPAARSVTSLLTLLSTAVRVSPADCSVSSPMRLRLWKVSRCSGP